MSILQIVPEATKKSEIQTWNGREYHVETKFIGTTLRDWERNGYHDSDFYATVYDTEMCQFRDIMYGTTRGCMFPQRPVVDATEAVRALYKAYEEGLTHMEARRVRARRTEELLNGGLTEKTINSFNEEFSPYRIMDSGQENIYNLLKSNPRKEFRQGLKKQVIEWLDTPKEERKYNLPLSPKQLMCLRPYRPW